MRIGVLGFLLFIAASLTVAPASAFHGCPYSGEGLAVAADGSGVFLATVHWGGQTWCPQFDGDNATGDELTFTVTITHPTTGAVIVSETFAGGEDIPAALAECEEIVAPYFGWDEDPDVAFEIVGYQENNLCVGDGHMTYAGTFSLTGGPVYALTVVVDRYTN